MRVAIIGVHFAEYSVCLAEAMAKDHDVLLIAEHDNLMGELGLVPESNGSLTVVTIHRQRTVPSLLKSARTTIKALHKFQPEIVHAQEFDYDFAFLVLPFLWKWPYVLTVHDPERHHGEELRGLTGRRKELIKIWQRRACDYAITHGAWLRRELEKNYPHLQDRVAAVPHGVLGVRPNDPPGSPVRPGRLLMLGRLHPYKGLDVFVDAVETLASHGLPAVGVIAGRGPSLDALRDRVLGKDAFEVHEGYLSRATMLQLVDEADVVVLPYINGTQSGIGMLAIGRGRSVVASRVGSLPEIVLDEVNGVVVPPGDPSPLARVLGELVQDRGFNGRLREGASRLCTSEYSWDRIAHMTSKVYLRALAQNVARRKIRHRVAALRSIVSRVRW